MEGAEEGLDVSRQSAARPPPGIDPALRPSRALAVVILVVGIPVLLRHAGDVFRMWEMVFDDAFITFRYARNLAEGYGITWNPGQPPTEGYTNFLLVLLLAPFIALGLDPLTVSRVLAYAALAGTGVLLYRWTRRRLGAAPAVALLVGVLAFLLPSTSRLAMTGLETVPYAFLLLASLMAADGLFDPEEGGGAEGPALREAGIFAGLLFLSMLLRPEAALLFVAASGVAAYRALRRRSLKPIRVPLIAGGLLLAAGSIYLGWKLAHLGALLPNPFWIKASGSGPLSHRGVRSVMAFLRGHPTLLGLAVVALATKTSPRPEGAGDLPGRVPPVQATGWALVVLYLAFYARTETIMDVGGRFLFPLGPVLVLLASPLLVRMLGFVHLRTRGRVVWTAAASAAFLLVFAPGFADVVESAQQLRPGAVQLDRNTVMMEEYRIARRLSRYPGIRDVHIAFGDSGVIPYYTGARWLDVVGLNDSFIARRSDLQVLVDYFFRSSPDVAIQVAGRDHAWLTEGHGPLGNLDAWADDPRWDDYDYVGTNLTSPGSYDLHWLLRRGSPHRDRLGAFLRTRVVDGWYEVLPLRLGTQNPPDPSAIEWIPAER